MKSISNSKNLIKKDRYIIITDLYFMIFDPAPNYKNMAKLIFYGDIRQLNIVKTENYHEKENAHSYILYWKKDDKFIIESEILFCNTFINTNFSLNPIQDFIDLVNRRTKKLKENFKVFQEDYKKPIESLSKKDGYFDNLIGLSKYYDNKFSIIKNNYIAKNQIILYEIIFKYYLDRKNFKAEEFFSKIQNMKNINEFDNKIPESYDVVFNLINNYELSRSYSDYYNENYI
jgi:hypothetical protein